MLDRTCHITPDLISDYVADKLDDDARVVEEAIEHNDGIAAAVATNNGKLANRQIVCDSRT